MIYTFKAITNVVKSVLSNAENSEYLYRALKKHFDTVANLKTVFVFLKLYLINIFISFSLYVYESTYVVYKAHSNEYKKKISVFII